MADHRWSAAELGVSELRHLHQATLAIPHVVAQHVVDALALVRCALHIDVAHLAALVGEPGVIAAGEGCDAVHRLLIVDVQRPHHVAVDRQANGGRAGVELGVERGEITARIALLDQLIR